MCVGFGELRRFLLPLLHSNSPWRDGGQLALEQLRLCMHLLQSTFAILLRDWLLAIAHQLTAHDCATVFPLDPSPAFCEALLPLLPSLSCFWSSREYLLL